MMKAPCRDRHPPGPVVALDHVGSHMQIGRAFDALFASWPAESGREPADAPVVEEYLNSPRDTSPADLVTHIHAKLTPVWRVLDSASPTISKLSFDTALIRERRELEGLSR